MKIDTERCDDRTVVRIAGDVTIQGAGTVARALNELDTTAMQPLEVELEDAGRADLTFLQLVCALHRQCASPLALTGPGAQTVRSAARLAAMAPSASCPDDLAGECPLACEVG